MPESPEVAQALNAILRRNTLTSQLPSVALGAANDPDPIRTADEIEGMLHAYDRKKNMLKMPQDHQVSLWHELPESERQLLQQVGYVAPHRSDPGFIEKYIGRPLGYVVGGTLGNFLEFTNKILQGGIGNVRHAWRAADAWGEDRKAQGKSVWTPTFEGFGRAWAETKDGDAWIYDPDKTLEEAGINLDPGLRQIALTQAKHEDMTPEELAAIYGGERLAAAQANPQFAEAIQVLKDNKASFGRNLAASVVSPGSKPFQWISGGLDAAFDVLADPTLFIGKAFKGAKAARSISAKGLEWAFDHSDTYRIGLERIAQFKRAGDVDRAIREIPALARGGLAETIFKADGNSAHDIHTVLQTWLASADHIQGRSARLLDGIQINDFAAKVNDLKASETLQQMRDFARRTPGLRKTAAMLQHLTTLTPDAKTFRPDSDQAFKLYRDILSFTGDRKLIKEFTNKWIEAAGTGELKLVYRDGVNAVAKELGERYPTLQLPGKLRSAAVDEALNALGANKNYRIGQIMKEFTASLDAEFGGGGRQYVTNLAGDNGSVETLKDGTRLARGVYDSQIKNVEWSVPDFNAIADAIKLTARLGEGGAHVPGMWLDSAMRHWKVGRVLTGAQASRQAAEEFLGLSVEDGAGPLKGFLNDRSVVKAASKHATKAADDAIEAARASGQKLSKKTIESIRESAAKEWAQNELRVGQWATKRIRNIVPEAIRLRDADYMDAALLRIKTFGLKNSVETNLDSIASIRDALYETFDGGLPGVRVKWAGTGKYGSIGNEAPVFTQAWRMRLHKLHEDKLFRAILPHIGSSADNAAPVFAATKGIESATFEQKALGLARTELVRGESGTIRYVQAGDSFTAAASREYPNGSTFRPLSDEWLAYDDEGNLAGILQVMLENGKQPYVSVAVREDAQRRGIATRLIERAMQDGGNETPLAAVLQSQDYSAQGAALASKFAAGRQVKSDAAALKAARDYITSDPELIKASAWSDRMLDGRTVGIEASLDDAIDEWARVAVDDVKSLTHDMSGNPLDEVLTHLRNGKVPELDHLEAIPLARRPAAVVGEEVVRMDTSSTLFQNVQKYGFKLIEKQMQYLSRRPILDHLIAEELKSLRAEGLLGKGIASADEIIAKRALSNAMERMINMVDDAKVRSQFAALHKSMVPFHYAHDAFIKRWWKRILRDPAVVRKAQLIVMGVEHSGFTEKDSNGDLMFHYPLVGLAFKPLLKGMALLTGNQAYTSIPVDLTGKAKYLLPGADDPLRPGIGPLVTVPLKLFQKFNPELSAAAQNAIAGKDRQIQPVWEQLVPPVLAKAFKAFTGESDQVMSAMNQAIAFQAANDLIPAEDAPPGERQAFIHRTRQWARTILGMRTLFGFTVTGGAQVNLTDSLHPELRKAMKNLPINEALAQFMKLHPDASPYTVFSTEGATGLAPHGPTAIAGQWMRDNAGFMNKHGVAATWFIPQAPGAFDRTTWNEELASGFRTRRSPDEFWQQVQIQGDQDVYFRMRDAYKAKAKTLRGFAKEQADADWQVTKKAFLDTHPVFASWLAEGQVRAAERNQTLQQVRAALADPKAPKTPSVPALQEVLAKWDEYQSRLAQFGTRSSASAGAAKEALTAEFIAYGTSLADPAARALFTTQMRPQLREAD